MLEILSSYLGGGDLVVVGEHVQVGLAQHRGGHLDVGHLGGAVDHRSGGGVHGGGVGVRQGAEGRRTQQHAASLADGNEGEQGDDLQQGERIDSQRRVSDSACIARS